MDLLFEAAIAGYLGFGDTVSFNKVLSIASEKGLKKKLLKILKYGRKTQALNYGSETLSQVTPYYFKT